MRFLTFHAKQTSVISIEIFIQLVCLTASGEWKDVSDKTPVERCSTEIRVSLG